ncbi:hypothetical protein ASC95_12110 [Pelomonas sp. Root1217]|uniref:hypothetical protein n=1 Tax=Pelomonas sp. Root1217 TaxID=1736430 RepID=UPI00070FDA6C|nr:hypothetical protein [Pelomonas sp. Root1217]KQV53471.1 hypothetical protein ASC95_12110 [Pelomonas sp. Root1217]
MFQKRSLIAALLMMAAASVIAADEALTIDDGDQSIAASLLPESKRMRQSLKLDKLRDSKHPDGVLGSTYFSFPEALPVSGEMDPTLEALQRFACRYAVFGIAELQNSKSFIGKDEIGIFTKLHFKLVDSWSVQPASKVQSFELLVQGGEVQYKGEIIRLGNPQAAYVKGRHYLMIMHSATDKNRRIFAGTPYLLEISNETIYPAAPGWSPFESGTTVTRAKAMVQESLEQEGCK